MGASVVLDVQRPAAPGGVHVTRATIFTSFVLLAGCGVGEGPAGVASTREALRGDDDGIIIGNGLATSDLAENALTGHPVTLEVLATSSLESAASSPEVLDALVDRAAERVLRAIAECALSPAQTLTLPSGLSFPGAYGICPGWKVAAPTADCLETVSACLLARNNGLGRHVHVSARGEPNLSVPARFTAAPRLPPRPWVYDSRPASLLACTPTSLPRSGLARDCGWRSQSWHKCTPGASVLVGYAGRDPGACGSPTTYGEMAAGADVMLRVCRGDLPCDAAAALAQSDGACGSIRPAVRFTCPSEGRFVTMAAPWTADVRDGAVATGTVGAAPVPEMDVFPVREGAFLGNLFDPSKLNIEVVSEQTTKWHKVTKPPVPGAGGEKVVYRGFFSCADDGWQEPDAYRASRVCAAGSGDVLCLSNYLGRCSARCTVNDGPLLAGDLDFEGCSDDTGYAWRNPLTVFLQNACDLAQSCKR